MTEKALTGSDAWTRLFSELTSAIRVELPDAQEGVALDVALSKLVSPDRDVRRTTAEAVTAALEPGLRTRAYVFNTLLHDKAVDDRLRSYPNWLAARNLANEASDESVQALLEAVRSHYELPRRWYRLKAELLGLDKLADYDRMAAVADEEVSVEWPEASDLVLSTFHEFSPVLGDLAQRFFDERWIDAPVRPNKRGGRVLRLHDAERAPLRDAQLHGPPPRRAGARPRARPRPARRPRDPARAAGAAHAADRERDRLGVRRDARLPPAARRGRHAPIAAGAARREHRGLDRDRLPPDGDERLRGARAHRAARARAS